MTSTSYSSITILKGVSCGPEGSRPNGTISFDELKGWIRRGTIAGRLLRYRDVRLVTSRVETLPKPLLTALLLRSLSRSRCHFEDEQGRRVAIGVSMIARLLRKAIVDWIRKPQLLRTIDVAVDDVPARSEDEARARLDLSGATVYLRTDLVFGLQSGGSIGHIAGVLNHLDEFTGDAVFLTTDHIPTVRPGIETHVILPDEGFGDFVELPGFAFNATFEQRARPLLDGRRLAFIYQRYSTNNYAGAMLARRYQVPFVLEYNGSEIWINRHWGRALRYEALSERIELFNLRAADLIVVVSKPMKDELVARGLEPGKILVNPNGVDPERYSPAVNGAQVRERHGLKEMTVLGFIGTFGPWHGAEILAEAFARLVNEEPALRERLRLLMIGDGAKLPQSREILARAGVLDACIFTGRIPQADGPGYLAACDILASPHVANSDGSRFFGSPTKLFEYMAMGKAIVASQLEQIGEVLEHERTAHMVTPGHVPSLVDGLRRLIDDEPTRERLGRAARLEVVTRYTWREHTRKIIQALEARCA